MKFKDFGNAIIHKLNLVFLQLRLFSHFRLGLLSEYQPNPFEEEGRKANYGGRPCVDRFEAFSKVFRKDIALSTLDIGCNSGYFIFRMAERNGFCIGVDIGRNQIMAAQALAYVHDVRNVAFAQFRVTPETVYSLPKVDVLICLSVFHHFVRHFGETGALEIMKILSKKTQEYLVFETGQPNERSMSWANELAFMKPDPQEWITNFLKALNFEKVHRLGKFKTSVSDVKRYLFVGERGLEKVKERPI